MLELNETVPLPLFYLFYSEDPTSDKTEDCEVCLYETVLKAMISQSLSTENVL